MGEEISKNTVTDGSVDSGLATAAKGVSITPDAVGSSVLETTVSTEQQTTHQEVSKGSPESTKSLYTKEEVDALLSKVRADEKSKVYKHIDTLKAQKESTETKSRELQERLKSLEEDLDGLRQGKTTEVDSITKELADLRDTNRKLEAAIDLVATNASLEVTRAKLDAYRDKLIAEKGLVFVEAVKGDTEEEIRESVESALKKQSEVEKAAMEKAIEKIRRESSKDLPQPIAVEGQVGQSSSLMQASPTSRRSLAKLPKDEYQKRRAQMLEEAKRKVGLIE